jgi:hypothetical protein
MFDFDLQYLIQYNIWHLIGVFKMPRATNSLFWRRGYRWQKIKASYKAQ